MTDVVRSAGFADLDVGVFHDLIKLRVDTFIVEQDAPYSDLDGRDNEPDAVHWWVERDGRVIAVLRVLVEPGGGYRLGRVVTEPAHRGEGLSARLISAALEGLEGPTLISAQAQLEEWYAGFGFERTGPDFIEDGIPHVPMIRPAGAADLS